MTLQESEKQFEKNVAKSILASVQKLVVGEAGKTGAWRSLRPQLDKTKCIVCKTNKPSCHYCWLYCPENTISRTIPPEINFDYCKGCGICAHECPTHAITMVPEKNEPSCGMDEAKKANEHLAVEP